MKVKDLFLQFCREEVGDGTRTRLDLWLVFRIKFARFYNTLHLLIKMSVLLEFLQKGSDEFILVEPLAERPCGGRKMLCCWNFSSYEEMSCCLVSQTMITC
jgi:hypothetical protein